LSPTADAKELIPTINQQTLAEPAVLWGPEVPNP
jgi:hypothetical protein